MLTVLLRGCLMNEIVTTYLSRVNIYISVVNIYFSDANIYIGGMDIEML